MQVRPEEMTWAAYIHRYRAGLSRDYQDIVSSLVAIADRRAITAILCIVAFAYFAELADPTFHADYFLYIQTSAAPYSVWSADGRYLGELIRRISDGTYPPTLHLMVGLVFLVLSGFAACLMFDVKERAAVVIVCSIFAAFPMMFESFAYHAIRVAVPLALFFAMMAVVSGRILIGAIFVVLSLTLYQSALYASVVVTILATAVQLGRGLPIAPVFLRYTLPRAAAVVLGLVAYAVLVSLYSRWTGYSASRLSSFARFAADPAKLLATAKMNLAALGELYLRDQFLFPVLAKYMFLAVTAVAVLHLVARRQIIAIVMLLAAPLGVFGAAWITYPVNAMLSDRILFSFVVVYGCTFLAAWTLSGRWTRRLLCGLGGGLVIIFILQANMWHEYMALKTRADIDMAEDIADEIQRLPDYSPDLPVVVVGAGQPKQYLPYRAFDISRGLVTNGSLLSSFAVSWSADRLMMFFLPMRYPTKQQALDGAQIAKGLPLWPSEGSVKIQDGLIVVSLGRK